MTSLSKLELILLLEAGTLTDWEKGFIRSLKKDRHYSEKQQLWFEKIVHKYLKATSDKPLGSLPKISRPP